MTVSVGVPRKTAIIYLRMDGPVMTGQDLDRLMRLRTFAISKEYVVKEVWPVHGAFCTDEEKAAWEEAKGALEAGECTALVYWHETAKHPYRMER